MRFEVLFVRMFVFAHMRVAAQMSMFMLPFKLISPLSLRDPIPNTQPEIGRRIAPCLDAGTGRDGGSRIGSVWQRRAGLQHMVFVDTGCIGLLRANDILSTGTKITPRSEILYSLRTFRLIHFLRFPVIC